MEGEEKCPPVSSEISTQEISFKAERKEKRGKMIDVSLLSLSLP